KHPGRGRGKTVRRAQRQLQEQKRYQLSWQHRSSILPGSSVDPESPITSENEKQGKPRFTFHPLPRIILENRA
ncbi:MAG: hypothetical protein LBS49_12645, partial [Candidatus Accumulibacter sp.]|nr:hypothetical protein [Accumulibacter sp.]